LKCVNTAPYGPAAGGYLIQTEGYGTAPVYSAAVSGLTLTGPDAHTMSQFPFGNPAQGAPTCTPRVGTASTTDGTSYASGNFTPAVNDLLVVFVVASDSVQATAALSNSAGLNFTQFKRATFNTSADSIYGFVSDGLVTSATSQTVTFTTSDPATGTVIFVSSVAGMSRTGLSAILQSAQQDNGAASGTPAPAFSLPVFAGNPALGVIGNRSNPANMAPPTGWTEAADAGYATPTTGGEYVFRNSGLTGKTITWGGISDTAFGAMIVELDASALETYAGVRLDAIEAVVDNCHIRQIRGPAVRMYRRPRTGYDGFEYRVSNSRLVHCYVGIEAVTDGRYNDNVINSIRDYCLYMPTNQGNVQSTGNHFFGAQKAIYAVNSVGFHSTNDVFSDAGYGLHLTGYSDYANITNGYTQHCWLRNIHVGSDSDYSCFTNCSVQVAQKDDDHPGISGSGIVGVEFSSRGNQFLGGTVFLSTYTWGNLMPPHNTVKAGGTAFLISGGSHSNQIKTVVVSPTGQGGSSEDDICVRFAAASSGNNIDITIPYGFVHTDTRLLVIDDGVQSGMKNNTITFRGPNLGPAVTTPANFVDIGTGGIDGSNKVYIIDSDEGDGTTNKRELTAGQSY
jgi:hypothetical protein